jgi:polysaccharide biosynthesis transport protein
MNNANLPILSEKNGEALHLAPEIVIPEVEERSGHSGLSMSDILLMLFRHKWKIIFFAWAGLLIAGAIYLFVPSIYESQAKLLVRYVVDHSAVDAVDSQIKTPTPENSTLINSELQILTSSDLIRQVVESVGIDRFPLGTEDGSPMDKAVQYIYHNLEVMVVRDTNIISVTFRSLDPTLPKPVVQDLVKRYFDKHLEVHRSTGAFDFVARETADLKNELAQTDAELKRLKDSAGIISLTEAKADLATELGKTQQELDSAESELAGQQARVKGLEKSLALTETHASETPAQPVSGDIQEKYKALLTQLTQLQKAETDLLLKYTSQNPIVKVKAAQIQELEKQRADLEKDYPTLLNTAAVSVVGRGAQPDITSERATLAGLESKVAALTARMSSLQAQAKTISEVAPRIQELERKAEVDETNYKHSEASLQKARIDETLDPSRMPNISVVQTPSPAMKAKRNVQKVVLGIAGGGFAVGIGLALLIELMLDKTIKRPLELEKQLHVPLLMSIPYLHPGRSPLRLGNVRDSLELTSGADPEEVGHVDDTGVLLKPFCEAIRDRLGVFFQANNMSYKPKLVAVTGLAKNAGASTLAAGLAGALSEISEGKVLLVDKLASVKGFYNMLAEFKRSDLDYVIFDMPALGDTSATLPLAGFMDTMLLVVEAGKSNRDVVKRAYTQLAAKTNVSVVFNKGKSYGPKWLEGEV